jgi:hypothetical protein
MAICVKKEATVEDVVGYVLYQYIDQKRQPSLEGKLSIVFWNMRIVEDDGEIDEDLPGKIIIIIIIYTYNYLWKLTITCI